MELQHLGFRIEADLWQYDSARSSAADGSEIAKLFKIILRAKVRYFLKANNQVERMEGVEELLNRLNVYEGAKLKPGMTWDNQALDNVLSRILSRTPQPSDNAVWGLRKMFNEDYFKNKLDPSFLPGKAVQPGDTWTFSRESRKHKGSLFSVNLLRECRVIFRRLGNERTGFVSALIFTELRKPVLKLGLKRPKQSTPSRTAFFPVRCGLTWNRAERLKST